MKMVAVLAALVISIGVLTSCGDNADKDNNVANNAIEKPQKISMMTNTFLTGENNQESIDAFCAEYEKMTGIQLNIAQPMHNDYYESVNISLATDMDVDMYEVGSLFYPNYAMYDLVWDMTDAWENSSIKSITDESYVNALKINGRLYGFPLTKGNGTVTYIREDWLRELNIQPPKTYDDFYSMLKSFKQKGSDIIPITAAGLVNSESPYNLYLREFYQDATPDFILKNGQYVDGMTEPEMKEALARMKQAYTDGLLDPNIIKNKTSDCRNKFYAGQVGCFNYWAGVWGETLNDKVKENFPEANVVAMEPIDNIKYIERPPLAMLIPKTCSNPEGVFKYLIEFSHDGGDGQMLFTRGVENYHWRKVSSNVGEIIPEHKISSIYLKTELSFNNFVDIVPLSQNIADSVEIFDKNSTLATLPVTSKNTGGFFPDVDLARREIIEEVVTTDMTIEEGLQQYDLSAGKLVSRILVDLNSSKENEE